MSFAKAGAGGNGGNGNDDVEGSDIDGGAEADSDVCLDSGAGIAILSAAVVRVGEKGEFIFGSKRSLRESLDATTAAESKEGG